MVRVIENTAALEANLRSGAVDYIPGELGLSIDQALAFEKRFGADFNIVYKPGLIYEHIDLNLDTPILADRRVRRALLHGIDRVAISEQLFGGHQPVAHSFVNPSDWIYTEDVRRYRFDPARARALLEEAGWRVGPRRYPPQRARRETRPGTDDRNRVADSRTRTTGPAKPVAGYRC